MKKARTKTPKKQIWSTVFKIFLILLWVASVVIFSQVIVGLLMLLILGKEVLLQPVPTAIYSAVSYALALALIILLTPKIIKKHPLVTRKDLGLDGLPTWTDIGLAPVGFVVSIILAMILVGIFNLFPWFDAGQTQNIGFNSYLAGFDRIVAFITLVIVAPIAEEIIFRGWLYNKLRQVLSEQVSKKLAIILSIFIVSLIFGIIHMQWNVGVNVFALSIVLCGLREITGTIYAGILVHMIKNGLAFYLLYVLGIG